MKKALWILIVLGLFGCSNFEIHDQITEEGSSLEKREILYDVCIWIEFKSGICTSSKEVWNINKFRVPYKRAQILREIYLEFAKEEIKIWKRNYKKQRGK